MRKQSAERVVAYKTLLRRSMSRPHVLELRCPDSQSWLEVALTRMRPLVPPFHLRGAELRGGMAVS